MQTRCPNCDTLYRIDQDELTPADGQVRCYRCETVFDAYQHKLAEDDNTLDDLFDQDELVNDTGNDSSLTQDTAEGAPLDSELDLGPQLDTEDKDESEPDLGSRLADEDTQESELNLIELADSLRSQAQPTDFPGDLNLDDLNLDDLDLDDLDLEGMQAGEEQTPELSPEEQAALDRDLAPPAPQRKSNPALTIAQTLLALLLGLGVAGQLAWQQREQLLKTPNTRALAEQFCQLAGCRLPLLRSPEAYRIVHRQLRPANEANNALTLQLSFRNQASFAQALPDLQLSLFDREEKLIARRRLLPNEYLFPATTDNVSVAAEEVITIELLFEDPGTHASGFKLDFL